jgi:hypothetical protein
MFGFIILIILRKLLLSLGVVATDGHAKGMYDVSEFRHVSLA